MTIYKTYDLVYHLPQTEAMQLYNTGNTNKGYNDIAILRDRIEKGEKR